MLWMSLCVFKKLNLATLPRQAEEQSHLHPNDGEAAFQPGDSNSAISVHQSESGKRQQQHYFELFDYDQGCIREADHPGSD